MKKTLILIIILLSCNNAYAEIIDGIPLSTWVSSIYKAEGGASTNFPYGIKSIPCSSHEQCKRYCENTVRNNWKRYNDYGYKQFDSYIEFLGSRYAPLSDHALNKHWIGNVRYFNENALSKGRGTEI